MLIVLHVYWSEIRPRYFYKVLVLDLIMAPNVILEGIEFKVPCGETIWWIFVLYSHALKVHAEIL